MAESMQLLLLRPVCLGRNGDDPQYIASAPSTVRRTIILVVALHSLFAMNICFAILLRAIALLLERPQRVKIPSKDIYAWLGLNLEPKNELLALLWENISFSFIYKPKEVLFRVEVLVWDEIDLKVIMSYVLSKSRSLTYPSSLKCILPSKWKVKAHPCLQWNSTKGTTLNYQEDPSSILSDINEAINATNDILCLPSQLAQALRKAARILQPRTVLRYLCCPKSQSGISGYPDESDREECKVSRLSKPVRVLRSMRCPQNCKVDDLEAGRSVETVASRPFTSPLQCRPAALAKIGVRQGQTQWLGSTTAEK
jgi:hypothetical protein